MTEPSAETLRAVLEEQRRWNAEQRARIEVLTADRDHARHWANEQFAMYWLCHYRRPGNVAKHAARIGELEALEEASNTAHGDGDLIASDGWRVGQPVVGEVQE